MHHLPKIIVFDAFGALVKISESRSPYRKLMRWLKASGTKPSEQDAKIIMSNPVDIAQLSRLFGAELPKQLLEEINNDLQLELSTITSPVPLLLLRILAIVLSKIIRISFEFTSLIGLLPITGYMSFL